MADVVMRQVSRSFGKVEVVRGVDLEIEGGGFCVFVGPSGCGKSTLLRMIAGLEDISAGDLFIGGSANAWRSDGRSSGSRGCSFSTRRCACRCASRSPSCTPTSSRQ